MSKKCIIVTRDYGDNVNNKPRFGITDTKLYVPVVTLSTQDNEKLLQKIKPGFKRRINLYKNQSDLKLYPQELYLDHLIKPKFQG